MSDSDHRGLHRSSGDAYDFGREETVGDTAFDREDHRGFQGAIFDAGQEQHAATQPDECDVPVDLFLGDPSPSSARLTQPPEHLHPDDKRSR